MTSVSPRMTRSCDWPIINGAFEVRSIELDNGGGGGLRGGRIVSKGLRGRSGTTVSGPVTKNMATRSYNIEA